MATSLTKIRKAVKSEIRLNRKLFAIINILLAAGAVFFGIMSEIGIFYGSTDRYFYLNDPSMIIFGVGIASGLIAVIVLFKELYSKQNADIQFSLPLNAKERYISKIAVLFEMHILPVIFWALAALGILCIKQHNTITGEIIGEVVIMILISVSLALFIDAVSVFCVSCCGALAESFYTSVLAIVSLSITPELFFETILEKYSGAWTQGASEIPGTWTLFSADFIGRSFSGALVARLIVHCLLSCAVLVLAYFIYRKRDGRTTGKPIVFRPYFEFFLLLGVFCCFLIFLYDSDRGIFILITLLAYLIIRIISTRAKITFKKLILWISTFASYLLIYTVVSAAAYYTDGFGYLSDLTADDLEKNNYCYVHIYQYTHDDMYHDVFNYYENEKGISEEQAIELYKVFRDLKDTQEKSFKDCMNNIFFDDGVDDYSFNCGIDSVEWEEYDDSGVFANEHKYYDFECSAAPEEVNRALEKIKSFDFWDNIHTSDC